MMMLKMMNPMSSMPSVSGASGTEGKEEPGLTREELQEQERLRKEAILLAERERHKKYRKQDEEREVVRQKIREKYNIEKPVTEDDDDEDDDDDYTFGPKKTVEKDDAIVRVQKMAEKQISEAKAKADEKCKIQ